MVVEEIREVVQRVALPETQKMEGAARVAQSSGQPDNAQAEAQPSAPVSRDDLESAIESLNRAVSLLNHRLNFSIDESTGRLMTKVIDNKTNEIIREIPPERVLTFVRKFEEFLGLLIDEKA